jgi:hypothetical protein
MPQYRKLPVVIEAIQCLPENDAEVVAFLGEDFAGHFNREEGTLEITIPTLEGDHLASPGDWIIRGIQGELYPCKPDIFAATYELVE